MKNLVYTIIVAGVVALTSCEEERAVPEFSNRIQEGNWKVTEMEHAGRSEAYKFDTYVVGFSEQNTIVASGVNFYRGWWEMREEGGPVLEIKFQTEYEVPFTLLNATWKLTEYNDQIIKMNYTNSSSGVTDYVTFEKN